MGTSQTTDNFPCSQTSQVCILYIISTNSPDELLMECVWHALGAESLRSLYSKCIFCFPSSLPQLCRLLPHFHQSYAFLCKNFSVPNVTKGTELMAVCAIVFFLLSCCTFPSPLSALRALLPCLRVTDL